MSNLSDRLSKCYSSAIHDVLSETGYYEIIRIKHHIHIIIVSISTTDLND